jgi:hypothetical protein
LEDCGRGFVIDDDAVVEIDKMDVGMAKKASRHAHSSAAGAQADRSQTEVTDGMTIRATEIA